LGDNGEKKFTYLLGIHGWGGAGAAEPAHTPATASATAPCNAGCRCAAARPRHQPRRERWRLGRRRRWWGRGGRRHRQILCLCLRPRRVGGVAIALVVIPQSLLQRGQHVLDDTAAQRVLGLERVHHGGQVIAGAHCDDPVLRAGRREVVRHMGENRQRITHPRHPDTNVPRQGTHHPSTTPHPHTHMQTHTYTHAHTHTCTHAHTHTTPTPVPNPHTPYKPPSPDLAAANVHRQPRDDGPCGTVRLGLPGAVRPGHPPAVRVKGEGLGHGHLLPPHTRVLPASCGGTVHRTTASTHHRINAPPHQRTTASTHHRINAPPHQRTTASTHHCINTSPPHQHANTKRDKGAAPSQKTSRRDKQEREGRLSSAVAGENPLRRSGGRPPRTRPTTSRAADARMRCMGCVEVKTITCALSVFLLGLLLLQRGIQPLLHKLVQLAVCGEIKTGRLYDLTGPPRTGCTPRVPNGSPDPPPPPPRTRHHTDAHGPC
jgi:hypothetical protein